MALLSYNCGVFAAAPFVKAQAITQEVSTILYCSGLKKLDWGGEESTSRRLRVGTVSCIRNGRHSNPCFLARTDGLAT